MTNCYCVVIFGTGKYGKEAYDYFGSENVLCFIDNNTTLSGTMLFDKEIYHPEQLMTIKGNYVVVLAAREELCVEMEYQLMGLGVEKFLSFNFLRDYMSETGMKPREFIQLCADDANIYKLMYKQELIKEKACQEKIEFFLRYADIRHVKPVTGKLRQRQKECLSLLKQVDKMAGEIGVSLILAEGNLLGAVRNKRYIPWDDDMDVIVMRDEYNRLIQYLYDNRLLLIPNSDYADYYSLNCEIRKAIKNNDKNIVFCLNGIFLVAYVIGTGEDLINVDIFPMDYYKEECRYEEVLNYITEEERKVSEKKKIKEHVQYNIELVKNNPLTSSKSTSKIGYGIETFCCIRSCKEFYKKQDVFPLVTRQFEMNDFKTPYNSEGYLRNLYGDIYQWPVDAGISSHGINRHYIAFKTNENYIYISSLEKMKNVIDSKDYANREIVIEKYKIRNMSEYFEIIELLEREERPYYVYA